LDELGEAQVIHANNVLAHTASLHSVIEGISILLSQNGVVIAEVQYFNDMAEIASFDMIYHEHLCYYVLGTFERLLNKHGLKVFHAEHISTHGGSLRIYASKGDKHLESKELCAMRETEEQEGLSSNKFYLRYAEKVAESRKSILRLLHELRNKGKKVAAYGAAAKTTVMFNYFGIDSSLIRYVIDRSPHKQGRFIPGTDLAIYPVERMTDDPPDYLFLSAWNLAEEIMKQLDEYARNGLKFIVPLPRITIL
jgi:hypothetical protein